MPIVGLFKLKPIINAPTINISSATHEAANNWALSLVYLLISRPPITAPMRNPASANSDEISEKLERAL